MCITSPVHLSLNMTPQASTTPTLVFYDGWCSMCIRSAKLFTKLDRNRGLVECIDLRGDDPRIKDSGADVQTLATSLHTQTPEGTLHAGPEAIRQAMKALGKGASVSWTRWFLLRPVVDFCYRIFARNRLRWFATHKCTDDTCTIK